MRIVVDAMGSDNFPRPDVEGAVLAAREYNAEIILTGDEARIRPLLTEFQAGSLPIHVLHAPEMLTMNDKGMALVLKAKRKNAQNSMAVGLDLVKSGEAAAFVTMGNTGAASVTAYFRLGTISGVDRPALAPVFPTRTGTCVVLDVGANPDCKPNNLLEFAVMGSLYAEHVRGVKSPRVGLLSNGEEAGKGNQLVIDSFKLLEQTPSINFEGNIESKEIPTGLADVVVTDGFTGNIFVKTAETTARLMSQVITEEIKKSPWAMLGALLARNSLRRVRERMDDSHYGGAVLLGLSSVVIVAHGRSNAFAVRHAIRVAKQSVEQDILAKIQRGIAALHSEPAPATVESSPTG